MTKTPDTEPSLFLRLTPSQIKEGLQTMPAEAVVGLYLLDHVMEDMVAFICMTWVEDYWTERNQFDEIIRDFEEPST